MKKRSLLSLVMALVLVVGAAFGTYAWFTDYAESKNNTVQAGEIDVTLDVNKGTALATHDILINTLAKPGDIVTLGNGGLTEITITNTGDFDMAYVWKFVTQRNTQLADMLYFDNFTLTTKTLGQNDMDYYEVVTNGVVNDKFFQDLANNDGKLSLSDWMRNGEWNIGAGNRIGALKPGSVAYMSFVLKFDESAGNQYENNVMNLQLVVNATQIHEDETIAKRALDSFKTTAGLTESPSITSYTHIKDALARQYAVVPQQQ